MTVGVIHQVQTGRLIQGPGKTSNKTRTSRRSKASMDESVHVHVQPRYPELGFIYQARPFPQRKMLELSCIGNWIDCWA